MRLALLALSILITFATSCKKPDPLQIATVEISISGIDGIDGGTMNADGGIAEVLLGVIEGGETLVAPLDLGKVYSISTYKDGAQQGNTQEITVVVTHNGVSNTTVLSRVAVNGHVTQTGTISTVFD